jgi:hypothetical protein
VADLTKENYKAICEWLGIAEYKASNVLRVLRQRKVKPMKLEAIDNGILATFGGVRVVEEDGGKAMDRAVFELMEASKRG